MTTQQNLWFDPDPSKVDEEDLSVKRSDAVVTATDWTAETILNQLKRGNIELSPNFQRREAWTDARKSAFIESLFLGLPVPQLVLAERNDKRGAYLVIDGKQRLLTLRRFAAKSADDDFKPLVLEGLTVRKDLNGKTLEQMELNPRFEEDVSEFQNQTIRTVVVRNWPNDDLLYLIFLRLNTSSVPLSTQELRQALVPGPFISFADEYSAQSDALQRALGLDAPDFRMRDVEILVRFFAFKEFIQHYRGNLKKFLDTACLLLNKQWATREQELQETASLCDSAIDTTIQIFGNEHAFRRWTGNRFDRPFNRAIFDIMTFYFSQAKVAGLAMERAESVVTAFRELCERNPEFNLALTTTTKSIRATKARIQLWGKALQRVLDFEVTIPQVGPPHRQ